jgi:aminoglycoside phosphotransferase (APT) family kinase protein
MRAANQHSIKQTCLDSIPALMRRHRLGSHSTIARDESGWVNPCFFVDDRLVFRFNARDVGLPKFQREKIVFDLLESSTLPTPRNVLLDDSRELAPYDVLISPRLPGTSVEQDWPELDWGMKHQLAENAGRLLSRLHEVSFPFFGELADRGPLPRTEHWIDYVQAKLCLQVNRTIQLGIFPESQRERCLKLLYLRADALNTVRSARLVHDDYHFGNLLHVGSEITGLLDFEWSFAGDPLYDYCLWYSEADLWPGSRAPFLKGCGETELSSPARLRLDVYEMIGNLTLCAESKLHFSMEEAARYQTAAEAHLDKLEKASGPRAQA